MTRRESHRHDFLSRFFGVSTACLLALVLTLDPVYGQDRPAPAAKAAPPGVAEQAKALPAPVILSKAQVVEDLRGRGQPTDAETLRRQGGTKPAPAATGTPPGLDRRPADSPSEPPAFARSKSALFAELEKSQEGRQMLEKVRNLRNTRGAGASGSGGSMPPHGAAFAIPGVLGLDGAPPVAPRFEYTVNYKTGSNTSYTSVYNVDAYFWSNNIELTGADACLFERVVVPSTGYYIVNLTVYVWKQGTDVRTYTYPSPKGGYEFGLVGERDVGYRDRYAAVPTLLYLSQGAHWFKFCDSGDGRFQPHSLKVYDL